MKRETLQFDIVIVGAGPAGLSCAIKLMQLNKLSQVKQDKTNSYEHNQSLKICILEKASEIGAQLLSGAAFEPTALNELIPDWKNKNAPLHTLATTDQFYLLTKNHAIRLPLPPLMKNEGNYIISLDQFCRWLAIEAESLGVEIFPGFAATEILYDEQGSVKGVATGDVGINKCGEPKSTFQPGIEIHAQYTIFAEGCRGSLTKQLMEKFALNKNCEPQTYGIGIKELWEIMPEKHQAGKIIHTMGWPLDYNTYGGSFIYHFEKNYCAIGLIIGLDYQNPYLDPFKEFQQFKHHPFIKPILKNGRRIEYGARAINEGGYQSIPQLSFPGGLLIGCAAGFLNIGKIKGNHTAMKSGMIAAEELFKVLKPNNPIKINNSPSSNISTEINKNKQVEEKHIKNFDLAVKNSWIAKELKEVRNIRPAFRWGLLPGLFYAGIESYILHGHVPWTFHHPKPDNETLKIIQKAKPINYPKPDGQFSFDKLTSIQLSNIKHEEDQLVHLLLKDPETPIAINLALYGAPEQRYCPAAVYEILWDAHGKNPRLQINAANCIHCKACDIKDPTQNITWMPPEGGSGPNYSNM